MIPLQIICEDSNFEDEARVLQEKFKEVAFEESFALVYIDNRLELRNLDKDLFGSVYVDFVSGALAHRAKYGGGNGQAVAKSVFSKMAEKPHVFDATGGLGRDAFILSYLGCHVEMFERNPVVRTLLADGLRRGYEDPLLQEWLPDRLKLREELSILELDDTKQCDVVYLDPMYPNIGRKAQVKKDMFLFHEIVGPDNDADALLPKALNIATKRVSVKRPKSAPFLNGIKTYSCIETKAHRFDIYVPNKKS
ncbi:MAG: class I SAM-dependent methyltransferase [Succinivibrionaceae bacterium]